MLIVHSKKQIAPVVSFRSSRGELVRGTITNLQRKSLVMEIYNPYSIVQVSEILSDLIVKAGTSDVYRGRAVVTSLVSTGLTAVVSVTLPDEWRELSVLNGEGGSFGLESRTFVDAWDKRQQVRGSYQASINELRAYLGEVSRWVAQMDMVADLPGRARRELDDDAFYELADPLIERMLGYTAQLESEARDVAPELTAIHRAYAQSALHPLLLRSPFVYRTYTKPLGYAGDYEMVNQIINNPRQGPNTYFEIVNVGFLRARVAEAHRNRIDILVEFLKKLARQAFEQKRPFVITNVGCGPAVEIQRFIREFEHSDYLHFQLIDFSDTTLSYTREALEGVAKECGKEINIKYIHNSVHELIKSKNRDVDSNNLKSDAVYCAGLFDYLSDKVCARLLEYFSALTTSGGKILVTNVHRDNPERVFTMEHLLEWYLIYRDESDLKAVFPKTIDGEIKTYVDATGVNVFAEARVS
jgi:extracellular factor (EF) 3-hydroxypalmitic acid methyl ester biosynthesis protein